MMALIFLFIDLFLGFLHVLKNERDADHKIYEKLFHVTQHTLCSSVQYSKVL
jgi:hypothetical protein